MRITTWNVNGLRAVLKNGGYGWIAENRPDIVCLQETRVEPQQLKADQLDAIGTHHWHWHTAAKLGYSGVATGFAQPFDPNRIGTGLGVDIFDTEGRVVRSDHGDFILFNIYFPNGSRDHSKVPFKLDFYARLLDLCDELHAAGRRIILTGDFNTSHNEIDLANPGPNRNKTGFLKEERVWIDRYLDHGFVDIWRARNPERKQYTWWHVVTNARARNVGWRLDYFLISEDLVKRVDDVVIHDEVLGSDHCPVSLYLK